MLHCACTVEDSSLFERVKHLLLQLYYYKMVSSVLERGEEGSKSWAPLFLVEGEIVMA